MRKYLLLVLLSGLAVSSFAQRKSAAPGVSSSIRVSTAVEAPQSNIDLLKQSLQSSGQVAGVAENAPASSAKPSPTTKQSAVSPASASASAASAAPAVVSAPNTLDMPLEMGGAVQSVQTTVEPVKKQLSPEAAKRVEQAKQKREAGQKKAKKPTVKPVKHSKESSI